MTICTLGQIIDNLKTDEIAITNKAPFIVLYKQDKFGHICFGTDNSVVHLTGQMFLYQWVIKNKKDLFLTYEEAVQLMKKGCIMQHQNTYFKLDNGILYYDDKTLWTDTFDWKQANDKRYLLNNKYYWINYSYLSK